MKLRLRAQLDAALLELGRESILDATREALVEVAMLVDEWSSAMNLTGHRGPEAVMAGLIVEAIALDGVLASLGDFAEIADLGSGAGFPGIPLALLDARRRVVCVDSRERRHHFQRAVKRRVNASNLTPIRGRIEVLEARLCDLTICQALAQPSEALGLALPWTRSGGLVVLPGGEHRPEPGARAEIVDASVVRYRVPGRGARTLWWGRRV